MLTISGEFARPMKRFLLLVLIVVGLVGAAIASAPFIAGTNLAKRSIAAQIEEWTGRPVTFTGEPRVKLFPFLSLTIDDAQISDPRGTGDDPIVSMDHLTCKLRLLPFLIGRIEVAEFQLIRPRFRLAVDADGYANWLGRRGGGTSGENPASETSRQIADMRLGRFRIIDGVITYDDARSGRHEEVKGLHLGLVWPSLGEAVSGTGTLSWRDEPVEFNVSVSKPLDLIAGGTSPARFAIASKPLRVSFSGSANSLADSQLEGAAKVTAPSVRRVAEWLGIPMGNGPILGAGLIDGKLNWIGRSLSFNNARMELDGNSAEGVLSLNLAGERPKLQGTLALERLDLSAYVETFSAAIDDDGPWPLAPVRMPLLDVADVDVRLSADRILIGTARLGRTAASTVVQEGKLSINVGEAQFYGGLLTGRAGMEASDGVALASARVEIKNTPAGAALRDLFSALPIDGTMSATIAVNGGGKTWGELVGGLAGTGDFKITGGSISGVELNQIAALAGINGVRDPASGSGTMPFRSITGELRLDRGTIEGRNIRAEGNAFAVSLAGKVSLLDAGVRARGVLNATRLGGTEDDVPFVIGGSWSEPLVLPDYERLIERGGATAQPMQPADPAAAAQPNG